MNLYYVSFCAPMGWQGAAFIEAESVVAATTRADEDGISPGGNALGTAAFDFSQIPDAPKVPDHLRNRRLGREELLTLWPDAADLMEYEDHV